MDPLSITASVITLLMFAKSTTQHLRAVKDSSKDCTGLILEVSSIRGLLTELKDRLDEDTQDGEDTNSDEIDPPWSIKLSILNDPDGPLDILKTALQALNERLEKFSTATGIKRAKNTFLWPYSTNQTKDLLNIIERQKSMLVLALENQTFRLAKAIKDDTKVTRQELQNIHEDVEIIRNKVSSLVVHHQDETTLKILDWIAPMSFATVHNDTASTRRGDFGSWLLRSNEYQEWATRSEKVLFCTGIPGAGKTHIASLVIDDLRTTAAANDDAVVAWFYFKYAERGSVTTATLLSSLLRQLVQGLSAVPETISALYYSHQGSSLSVTETRNGLSEVAKSYDHGFIVVDALDECGDTDEVRDTFALELKNLPANMQLLITSRHIESIKENFEISSHLEISAQDRDIKNYVLLRLGEEQRLAKFVAQDPQLESRIKKAVVEKSRGMFLMAKLHVDALARKAKYSKKAVMDAIGQLPKELDQTYHDVMSRINDQPQEEAELAMKVLTWVYFALQPLRTLQLEQALSIQDGNPFDDSDCYINSTLLVSVCAGLVVIDNESDIIRLVHFTTADYFSRYRDRYFPDGGIQISFICLRHLDGILERIYAENYEPLTPHYVKSNQHFVSFENEALFDEVLLSNYAVLNLVDHLILHLQIRQIPDLLEETLRFWAHPKKANHLGKICCAIKMMDWPLENDDSCDSPEFNRSREFAKFGGPLEAHRYENPDAGLMLIMKDLQSFMVRTKSWVEGHPSLSLFLALLETKTSLSPLLRDNHNQHSGP